MATLQEQEIIRRRNLQRIYNAANDGSSPVMLTIAYTSTQFVFKWKAPATSTILFDWGNGTTSSVSGNGATLVTTTSAYASAGTYYFGLAGDVTDITYIDLNNQTFVSGDFSRWTAITGLTYIDVSTTSISGSLAGYAGFTSMTTFNVDNSSVTGDAHSLVGLTSLTSFLFNTTAVTWGGSTAMSLTSATVNASSSGMSSTTQVDNFINSFKGGTGCTFNVAGTNAHRTSASNSNLNTLLANGNTITLNDTLGAELHTSLNAANDSATEAITAFANYSATIDGGVQVTQAQDISDMLPLGSAMNVSNCANSDYTTFSGASATGFHAESDGGGTHECGTADEITITAGKYYIATFDMTLNSGTAPECIFATALASGDVVEGGFLTASAGSNGMIFRADTSTTGVFEFRNVSTATNFDISNLAVKEIQVLGSDLVTNGSFASDTAWTKGTGWSIAAGVASCDGSQVAESVLSQAAVVTVGTTYLVKATFTRTAGSIQIGIGSTKSTAISAGATVTFLGTATSVTSLGFYADADFTGTIDNVTCHALTVTKTIASSTNYTGTHYVLPEAGSDLDSFIIPSAYTAESIVAQKITGETNATTGWVAGNNAVVSVSTTKDVGIWAIQAESNTTPTATANMSFDLNTITTATNIYRMTFSYRHVGTGDNWRAGIGSSATAHTYWNDPDPLNSVETTYEDRVVYWVQSDTDTRYFSLLEVNASNNGGVIFDNFSVKQVTFP